MTPASPAALRDEVRSRPSGARSSARAAGPTGAAPFKARRPTTARRMRGAAEGGQDQPRRALAKSAAGRSALGTAGQGQSALGRPRSRRAGEHQQHHPLLPFAVLMLVLLAAGLVAMLLLNTALAQGAFAMAKLQRTSASLSDLQQQLDATEARQESTEVLAARAKRLGMQDTCSPHFIDLANGRAYGEPCPASDAPGSGAPAAASAPAKASSTATPTTPATTSTTTTTTTATTTAKTTTPTTTKAPGSR